MGWLVFTNEGTSVRVGLERAIYEKPSSCEKPSSRSDSGTLHFASIFGGDTAIQAFRTALGQALTVTLVKPDGERVLCQTVYKGTETLRSDIRVDGRKRPLRHLIVASHAFLGRTTTSSVILPKYDAAMVWKKLVFSLGIPGIPAWMHSILDRLTKEKRIVELGGLNCTPVQITVSREELLEWLSQGLKSGSIQFPEKNGTVPWPSYLMEDIFPRPDARLPTQSDGAIDYLAA
jgi:hypothetical protein